MELDGPEGAVVLTCHHVVARIPRGDLRVRLPRSDGKLGAPVRVRHDAYRSRPEQDAVVLRVEGAPAGASERTNPLLNKLGQDDYNGELTATVLTYLDPDNFDATVRTGTGLEVTVPRHSDWSEAPERYRLRGFRLSEPTDSRHGISGGVAVCEGGVLGLAHFGREEGGAYAREAYLVSLSVWAEGWPALEDMIEPLVDRSLRGAATIRRGANLSVGIGADVEIDGYRPEVRVEREVDGSARRALDERGGVIVVGKPLSGKSRLALELLLGNPRAVVVIPRPQSPVPPEGFEASGFAGEEAVLLIDDLHRTAGTSQPLAWRQAFEEATGRPCGVVCTSRDGGDWRRVETEQERLLRELGGGTIVFTSGVGEPGRQAGEDLSEDQGRALAQELGMGEAEFGRRFEGTPGSLLLDLGEMLHRYEALRDERVGGVSMARLLDSAKLLHKARLPVLPHALVRAVAERVRGTGPVDQETWEALIRRTTEEGFARLDEETGSISYYSPYLERCVLYNPSHEDLEHLAPLMEELGDVVGLFFLVAFYGHDLSDYERALSLAERAVELDPGFAPSWYNLSYSLNHLGRNDEALEAIDRAIYLDPEYHPSYYSKGYALGGLNRNEEALECFREALRRGEGSRPGVTSMYLDGLSGALATLGRFYSAVRVGTRALSLYPPYRPTPDRLSNLLCGAGQPAYALEVAEEALGRDNEWPQAWLGKGLALDELGRKREALGALGRATELQRDLAQAWSRKSAVLLEMVVRVRASDEMARFLPAEDLDAHARALAGGALYAAEEAIGLGDDRVANRMNRGLALTHLDRHAEAVEAIEGALALEPANPLIHYDRGLIHLRARRYDEALDAFGHATWLAPGLSPPWWPLAMLLGGHFDRREGAALYAVNSLLRLEPWDPLSWFARGRMLAKTGRAREGQFWVERALGHEDVLPLPGDPAGRHRSALDFLAAEDS